MKTTIVYEDEGILVGRKPAGLATETASGFREDMVSELKNYVSRTAGERNPYLGLIHRLDQPVEGLLVFAKSKRAAADLSAQLAAGGIRKKYVAALAGIPAKKQGVCIDYLKKDRRSNLSAVVSGKEAGGKRAELSYRILAEQDGIALAEIELKTGRHHQIRVQMAHMGCPLIGDRKYGFGGGSVYEGSTGRAHQASGTDRTGCLALCAYYLEFDNPLTHGRQRFTIDSENTVLRGFTNWDT